MNGSRVKKLRRLYNKLVELQKKDITNIIGFRRFKKKYKNIKLRGSVKERIKKKIWS